MQSDLWLAPGPLAERRPEETAIGVDTGYATAVFAVPGDPPAG
jgi:hypothetical protein